VGFVLALTLPGLVLALLAVAAVDQAMLRLHGRGLVPWRRDSQVSSTGFDLLHATLSPGKADELAQRRHQELVRDAEADGAPPRSTVDLDAGVARLRLPPSSPAPPEQS
jgi:Family of unknown function (DUF6191)